MRVVVIGAGISGLAAADEAARRWPAAEVEVFEGAREIGGKLRVAEVGGVTVDVGAEALLARRPEGLALVRRAGLGDALIEPRTTAARLRAGGAAHPLPASTMLGIPSDPAAVRAAGLLTGAAADRVAAEEAAEPLDPVIEDVAVGALVRARFGREVLDRLVEPVLGGVYAGRADELSIQATMPGLAARLRDGGSLVGAARDVVTAAARTAERDGPVFASLAGGLGQLPGVLAAAGRFTVRTATPVRGLRRGPTGFQLRCGAGTDPRSVTADRVILATPAAKSAQLLREVTPSAAAELAAIETASVAIITLAYRDVTLPPGSGLLIGLREGFAVKAVTLSSQKWPLATGGLVLLRASLGRAGEAEVLQREDSELIALVRHELRALLGVSADPVDARVTRWGGGLPQYAVGHVARIARVRSAVAAVPGLAVCGATYDGVGIPACVASARAAVDRLWSTQPGEGE